jgi:hypothetical protein
MGEPAWREDTIGNDYECQVAYAGNDLGTGHKHLFADESTQPNG